ncbi:MAG: hypothetical protein ACUZ8I_01970 [Candidatus Scalindua sp.]
MIFDIKTPKDLFFYINRAMKDYCGENEKDAIKLLFLIMALNHLREWIAPGYNKDSRGNWPPANTAEKQFSKDIYELPVFDTIRKLCNKSKHVNRDPRTGSMHTLNIDEWKDFDSVASVDKGPATNYFVYGENVIDIINTVIDFYKTEWFERNEED